MIASDKIAWMGRDIEELSREELIEVVRELAGDIDRLRRTALSIIRMNEAARAHRARAS